MKIINLSLALAAFFVLGAGIAGAQTVEEPVYTVKADVNSCEINSLQFDIIRNQIASTRERIFVIFRRGNGESELVNAKRLKHVRTFLSVRKGWSLFDVIYARGEKVIGQSHIEFYIGGKLVLVILSKRNMSPCMDCCDGGFLESPQNLAPRTKRSKKSKGKR